MAPLPLENPNRSVSKCQNIEIRTYHVSPDCRSIDRSTMRSIYYMGQSIDNALDRLLGSKCLSPCAPSRCLILQRCYHFSPNTRALNGSNNFFSYFFASPTEILHFNSKSCKTLKHQN
jgi:hypothetical protein